MKTCVTDANPPFGEEPGEIGGDGGIVLIERVLGNGDEAGGSDVFRLRRGGRGYGDSFGLVNFLFGFRLGSRDRGRAEGQDR